MKTFAQFLEESAPAATSTKIGGGVGKGKPFYHDETTIDDHKSAMSWHKEQYDLSIENSMKPLMDHHGGRYRQHASQIEQIKIQQAEEAAKEKAKKK